MRLLHLKLLTDFRGLPAGSEFRFDNTAIAEDRIEPICLVGLNGSGKSNLLELLSEIFFYLESYRLAKGTPAKKFKTELGFELCFSRSLIGDDVDKDLFTKLIEKKFSDLTQPRIYCRKEGRGLPTMSVSNREGEEETQIKDAASFVLPVHVIAYSSGQNELLSNPYIKSAYQYFDEVERQRKDELSEELQLSRLFHLDYDLSQIATLCNYLFAQTNQVQILNEAIGISDVDSFSLILRFRNYRNNTIEFASALNTTINKLRKCATVYQETQRGKANYHELRLGFKMDEQMRRAFRAEFGSAQRLFRDFYFLNLMNIHSQRVETRNRIKQANSVAPYRERDTNIAAMLPLPERDRLVFEVEELTFLKKDTFLPIAYNNLSDGEHQLMHVLGSIILLNTSGSLLLYDEPETHFNPDWRSQLISLINKATREKEEKDGIRKQEIIITSHSPFIVSDCRRERVFIFDKGKARNPKINTYGTSVNILTEEVFGKKESISGLALQEIEDIKAKPLDTLANIQEAKEASRVLGESVEKVLLFRELLIREAEIKNDDTKL